MKASRVSDLRFAGYDESVFGGMVADTPLLFHGWSHWRRPLRTHRPDAPVERSPPASFSVIQPNTGVPLQRFWIPVHLAITVFVVAPLVLTFSEAAVRRFLLIGLGSYFVMRVWSGVYFIREMLTFQKIPLDAPPSPELSARVANWTFWTWFREPLDVLSFLCFLLALYNLRR